MRNQLTILAAGVFLFATACGGGGNSTGTGGGTGGATGGSSSGTPGGTSTGAALAAGTACSANGQCQSGVCGVNGSGNCCSDKCSADATCGATGCDDTGACQYPAPGTSCGTDSCAAGNKLTESSCNAAGACAAGTPTPCGNHLGCNSAGTACNTTCTQSSDCASAYVCNKGGCVAPLTVGACTENDDCYSGRCGVNGSGHCCVGDAGCVTGDATCGATDCEPSNGACNYASVGTACGSVVASCTNNEQQNASVCDGKGTCPVPTTVDCIPFICGAKACLATCSDDSSCGSGDFCDVSHATCCAALTSGSTISVDANGGNDKLACCSVPGHTPCQTLTQAMKVIDSAQAQNVTINAAVRVGSTWNPPTEIYPIVLGWGAELNAPGIFFYDPIDGGTEVIDIARVSSKDTVGYASIVGAHGNVVQIGPDEFGDQSVDNSMVQVEPGNTLYIANAAVNGAFEIKMGLDDEEIQTTAITVKGGGGLVLAQDKSAGITGTVTIGNALDNEETNGWNGIVCTVANGKGCTIADAPLKAGFSSIVIQGQENFDIDAEDFANIKLTSNPIIGLAPADAGFQTCNDKPDAEQQFNLTGNNAAAVMLNGNVNMTFNNGVVQCIAGDAFQLNASTKGNGNPTLTLVGTTIQNTDYGVDAFAGSATISNSTIQYNANGVKQGTDGTNASTLDLSSGGDGGTTTVVCSNSIESWEGQDVPGSSVLNNTTTPLNADNVIWDTSGPDLFKCDPTLSTCTCELSSCTVSVADGGFDGLDAVYTSSGTVDTSGNGLSTLDCTAPAGGGGKCDMIICLPPSVCCGPNECCSG